MAWDAGAIFFRAGWPSLPRGSDAPVHPAPPRRSAVLHGRRRLVGEPAVEQPCGRAQFRRVRSLSSLRRPVTFALILAEPERGRRRPPRGGPARLTRAPALKAGTLLEGRAGHAALLSAADLRTRQRASIAGFRCGPGSHRAGGPHRRLVRRGLTASRRLTVKRRAQLWVPRHLVERQVLVGPIRPQARTCELAFSVSAGKRGCFQATTHGWSSSSPKPDSDHLSGIQAARRIRIECPVGAGRDCGRFTSPALQRGNVLQTHQLVQLVQPCRADGGGHRGVELAGVASTGQPIRVACRHDGDQGSAPRRQRSFGHRARRRRVSSRDQPLPGCVFYRPRPRRGPGVQ